MKHAGSRGLRSSREGADQVDRFDGFACARVGHTNLGENPDEDTWRLRRQRRRAVDTCETLAHLGALARASLRNHTDGIALFRHQDRSSRAEHKSKTKH